MGSIALPGAKAQTGSRHKVGEDVEGVRGLKVLGVRDLHYKMAFLACSVQSTIPRFGGIEMPLDEITPEIMKKQMTDGEWQHMYEMSHDKNLYNNLINSLFPSIHGNEEVCIIYLFIFQLLFVFKLLNHLTEILKTKILFKLYCKNCFFLMF